LLFKRTVNHNWGGASVKATVYPHELRFLALQEELVQLLIHAFVMSHQFGEVQSVIQNECFEKLSTDGDAFSAQLYFSKSMIL
jgi:hypothetical protein